MRIWTLIDFGSDLSQAQRRATVIAKTPDDAMALASETCAMAFPADAPLGLPMIPTRRAVWEAIS